MTKQLKAYLVSRDHVETGDLVKSIKFTSDANLNFKLKANSYIQYLDEGKFLSDFFELPSTIKTIQDYLTLTLDVYIDET